MREEGLDKHPWRTLAIAIPAGAGAFMAVFFALQMFIQVWGGIVFDPSVWNFYWLMGIVGAIFGFERWWAYEWGSFNPHDRS